MMAWIRLPGLWGDPRRIVAALVLSGYVGISFAVENLYPFSVFDMFSRTVSSASRLVARDRSGNLVEVDRYEAWRCPEPIDIEPTKCRSEDGFVGTTVYLDASRAAYIASHPLTQGSGEPVDVVRRIWWLGEPGPPRTADCLLARCEAVRK